MKESVSQIKKLCYVITAVRQLYKNIIIGAITAAIVLVPNWV